VLKSPPRSPLKSPKKGLLAGAIALSCLGLVGYWYVFIAGAPQLDPLPAEQQTGLTFQVETVNSQAMGEERRYGVVLPPDYSHHPDQRYPVIVLLHGGHGNERDFEDKAHLTSVLHDLYQEQRLPPSLVVTPDGSDRRGSSPFWDPDYYDGPNGNLATWIGTELPQVIRSRYRTLNQPQFWAIGGLSSGGWGAFNIGLRNLNQFQTLFSHTGYFTDSSGPENSPQVLIQQIPAANRRHLYIYLDAGKNDHRYLTATRQFHAILTHLGIPNQFHVFSGGHGIVGQDVGWNYWHRHLADSLSFVGQRFTRALRQQETADSSKTHLDPVHQQRKSHAQSEVTHPHPTQR